MPDISVLSPLPEGKEGWKARRAIADVVRKVVVNAAIHRSHADLIEEVYCAGIYHGMKLSGPPPRKIDVIDVSAPLVRRRGRPRKDAQHAE